MENTSWQSEMYSSNAELTYHSKANVTKQKRKNVCYLSECRERIYHNSTPTHD